MGRRNPHNLPEQPNVLLGRDQELQSARELLLLGDMRLLSFTGPPGVGKTRLGLAAAGSVLEFFPQGIWFFDLAPLHDARRVGAEIARFFGTVVGGSETTIEDAALNSLAAYLRGCRMLIFLDNFEGVLPAAGWVGQLLERTTGLKMMVTSRERLRLRWEHTVTVQPLALPDLKETTDLAALRKNPSVTLFVQRAQAVNADFELTRENAPVIAALCARLDGLPLAIELAGACASVLTPVEILAHMDDRFSLLGMGGPDAPPRHQTLKAAIQWSYETLPPAEEQFLRQLSVFRGGFAIEAAERVGECEMLGLNRLAALITLVEKSLISRTRGPAGESRFTFLESIRDFLREELREKGEEEAARRRHALYFLELVEQNYAEIKAGHQKAWFDRLDIEQDNLGAAMQWSLDAGEPAVGRRIAAALAHFWWLRGHVSEGARWLETFLKAADLPEDSSLMRALEGAGILRGRQGDFELGRAYLMESLRLAKEQQDQTAVFRIMGGLCWICWVNGKTEYAAWLDEQMDRPHTDVHPWDAAYAFLGLGSLLYEAELDELAEKALTRSLNSFEFAGEKHGSIFANSKLALLKYKKGEYAEAQQRMMSALKSAGEQIDLYIIALCADDAARLAVQQTTDQQDAGAQGLEKIALILGAVDQWREVLSLLRTPREKEGYQLAVEHLRRRLGEAGYRRAWSAGGPIPFDQVIHEAISVLDAAQPPDARPAPHPEAGGPPVQLSERELQVLSFAAEGLSNQQIAERLYIAERTVRFHLSSIFSKLGAENRTQAVSIASRMGILKLR